MAVSLRDLSRVALIGSFFESTPEGLFYADEARRREDALRLSDRIEYELRREYERRIAWEVFYGPGVPLPHLRDEGWGTTPERFYLSEM